MFHGVKLFLYYQSQDRLSRSDIKVTVFFLKNGRCSCILVLQVYPAEFKIVVYKPSVWKSLKFVVLERVKLDIPVE